MTARPRHAFSIADDARSAVFTSAAAGPWSPGHCHGGAVAALVVHAVEMQDAPAPMQLARLTLELHRPVPTAAVDLAVSIVREGRKLQLLDVRLLAGGAEVARASVLRLRTVALELPAGLTQPTFEVSGPEGGQPSSTPAGMGFGGLFELSSVGGAFREPGPATIWFGRDEALAEGRAHSGAAMAAAVSDFSNGISSVTPFDAWTFVNADLTVNLAREPVGPWLLSDAETLLGSDGRAVARTRLADRSGWVGYATQSVLLDRR